MRGTRESWGLLAALCLLMASYACFFVLPPDFMSDITEEDHFYENLGAASLFAASALFAACFFMLRARTRQAGSHRVPFGVYAYLLISCIFFFGFGEEISWGQRIFGFQTSDAFSALNTQHEATVHNLWIFYGPLPSMDRMFYSAIGCYGCLLPALCGRWSTLRKRLEGILFPMPPSWIGICFAADYIAYKAMEPFIADHDALTEVKETHFEFLMFLLGVYFYSALRNSLKRASD